MLREKLRALRLLTKNKQNPEGGLGSRFRADLGVNHTDGCARLYQLSSLLGAPFSLPEKM